MSQPFIQRSRALARTALAVSIAAALAACGKTADPAATQVAATVNKEEISVHQINHALQRQTALRPEQAEAAGREVLERLIDQELAVQKAVEQKIDRDPNVVQAIEAARREILARAYVERVVSSVSKPTDDEIKAYYDDHPALFKSRRVYTFVEHVARPSPAQAATLQERMRAAKTVSHVTGWMKDQGIPMRSSRTTTPAEALPLNLLDRFAAMNEGQVMVLPAADSMRMIVIESIATDPKTLEQARPAIEQFLENEHKRKAIESDIKGLRLASRIDYSPKFVQPPGAAGSAVAAQAPAPAAQQPTPAASAAQALDSGALDKGLAGLK